MLGLTSPDPTCMQLLLERLRAMQQSLQAPEESTSRAGTAGGAPISSDQLPSSRFAHHSTAGGLARAGTSTGGALHSSTHSNVHSSMHSSMHGSLNSGAHSSGLQHAGVHTMHPYTGGSKSAGGASVATHSRGHDGSDTRRSDMDGVDTVAMNKIIEELQVMFRCVCVHGWLLQYLCFLVWGLACPEAQVLQNWCLYEHMSLRMMCQNGMQLSCQLSRQHTLHFDSQHHSCDCMYSQTICQSELA